MSSSLVQDPGLPSSPFYPPRSPSPAPSSTDSEGYEPESPLAEKSRAALLQKRRLQLLRRKAKRSIDVPKRWQRETTTDSPLRKDGLTDLAAWAAREGFKLVPKSPMTPARDVDSLQPPVRTVLFPESDAVPGPSYTNKVPRAESSLSETTQKRPAETLLAEPWDEDVQLATASEDEVDPPSPTPIPRKRARSESITSPDARKVRTRPAPLRLTSVPRRLTHQASPQRTPGRDTKNLHRTSPTSLLPRREKCVKRHFGSRSARIRDDQERRRRGPFEWVQDLDDERAVDGATYSAVLRKMKVTQRVRSSLLRRYQQSLGASLPAWRLSNNGYLAAVPVRQRRASYVDDEAVEELLPEDIEMRDDDDVDAALGDCNQQPQQIVGRKRALQASEGHVFARLLSAKYSHAEAVVSYLAKRKEYNAAQLEQRTKADAEKVERRAVLTKRILAAQTAQAEAEAAAEQVIETQLCTSPGPVVEALPESSAVAAESSATPAIPLFDQTQRERESRVRERRERVVRRRAVDRIEHVGPHPSRRLVERHARRRPSGRPTRPIPVEPSSPAPTERERAVSAQPETVAHVSPRRRALSVASQPSSVSEPGDLPPAYEFPFFPVVHSVPQPQPPRPRRHTATGATPPRYAPNMYSRRSPSPPPPYNAQSDADRQVLVPPVFLLDGESEEQLAWPVRIAVDRRGVPGGYEDEVEEIVFDTVPPAPVQRWFEEGEEEREREYLQQLDTEEERQNEEEERRGTIATVARWLGLW